MGYSTSFDGVLKFKTEPRITELAELKKLLGADCREHPEWGAKDTTYIDLEISDDFSGLKWSGAEKTYGLEESVNVVIREMRKINPKFGLSGELKAQGEEFDDRWLLVIGKDGLATKKKIKLKGKRVTCPECDHEFMLEEAQ